MSKFENARFSVIIPTLQRSRELSQVVEESSRHPLVGEVLVINNAPTPLNFDSPKVRVLQQEENIYVNPAWNLGVKESKFEFLAIVNDDVLFEPEAFNIAHKVLKLGFFGVVGPDKSCFENPKGKPRIWFAHPNPTTGGFGTFMCLRKENYTYIPGRLKIWGGDDLQILANRMPPGFIKGVKFETEMNTTSGDEVFQKLWQAEHDATISELDKVYYTKWWHRPFYFRYHLRKRINNWKNSRAL